MKSMDPKKVSRKVGKPKLYNCAVKTVTMSLPVKAIEAVKQFANLERKKYHL